MSLPGVWWKETVIVVFDLSTSSCRVRPGIAGTVATDLGTEFLWHIPRILPMPLPLISRGM